MPFNARLRRKQGSRKPMQSPASLLLQVVVPPAPFSSARKWNNYFDDAVDWIGTHKAVPYVITALNLLAVVLQCLGALEPCGIFRALRCVAGAVGVSAHAGELAL